MRRHENSKKIFCFFYLKDILQTVVNQSVSWLSASKTNQTDLKKLLISVFWMAEILHTRAAGKTIFAEF